MNEAWQKELRRRVGNGTLHAEQKLSATQPWQWDNWLQRILRAGSRSFHSQGDLEPRYQSATGGAFAIPSYLVPASQVRHWAELPGLSPSDTSRFRETIEGEKYFRFFIHPADLDFYRKPLEGFRPDVRQWIGTPSSSHRSLFAFEANGDPSGIIVLKLALRRKTMGFPRWVEPYRVARAVVTTAFVQQAHQNTAGKLPNGSRWQFLPEFFSLAPPGMDQAGFIARHLPPGFNPQQQILIPHFALLSESPEGRWIDRIFRTSGQTDREAFLWNHLFVPLLDLYETLALDQGISPELHKQNVGLILDRRTERIESLFVRDMDGMAVDLPYRHHLGLKDPIAVPDWAVGMPHVIRIDGAQLCQAFNFFFLGAMNLDQLAKGFLPPSSAQRLLKQANERHLATLQRKTGIALSSIGQLGKFWDDYHRTFTPPEIYDRVPRRERRNTQRYGHLRQFELWVQSRLARIF